MLKAREHIVWRKKKKLLVLLDTKSGCYFTLNATGQDLWLQHIVAARPLDDVAKEIARKYADPPPQEQVLSDCRKLIDEWHSSLLIENQG